MITILKKENNTPMVKMKKYALLFEVGCFLFLKLEVEKVSESNAESHMRCARNAIDQTVLARLASKLYWIFLCKKAPNQC